MLTKNACLMCIFAFLLGSALTGTAGYYFIVRESANRVEQYRSQQYRLEYANRNLEKSNSERQATITTASAIIASNAQSIQKLRAILLLLKEAEQKRVDSNRDFVRHSDNGKHNLVQ